MNIRMSISKFIFLFLFVLLCFNVQGQTEDFQSWNSLSVKKKINKKFTLYGEQEMRFRNNASILDKSVTELGGAYSINKYVKLKTTYRLTYNNDMEDGVYFDNRLYFDLVLKKKFDRFKFSFRERYQQNFAVENDDEFSYYNFRYLRHQLSLEYNLPKTSIEPFCAAELYQSLNNPIQNGIDKQRYTLGVLFPINKSIAFKIYYRFQKNAKLYTKEKNDYILGLGVKFDL